MTKPLSRAILKILCPKNNGVTTLTIQGHVTSSVTWPFHSPYPISYSSSIVTKPLSPALFENRDIRLQSAWPVQIVTAHARYHLTCTPRQNLGTYFNFSPPHCLFTITLIGLRWRIRGVYSWDPNVKREIERKFSKSRPKLGKFWRFWGLGVRGYKKFRFLPQKAHLRLNPSRMSHFAWRSVGASEPQACSRKKSKKVTETPIGKICRR